MKIFNCELRNNMILWNERWKLKDDFNKNNF